MMPYSSFQAFNARERDDVVPPGNQYVALMGPEVPDFNACLRAIDNIYVMGRLRLAEGELKPQTGVEIDGTTAIVAGTPVGTPRGRMLDGDEPLSLSEDQDPRGIVTKWLAQRGQVVLPENQVDVWLASRKGEAGEYEFHTDKPAGAILRAGQIVLCEVGFRIVPAGKESKVMRTELKTVAIVNANLTSELAFAQNDANNMAGVGKNIISISSAGPSGLTIKEKARVKRAPRVHRKGNAREEPMDALPFAS
ncbi:unnamed protein product [Peniophora sp. CBMAI 1063]|nr:unnamed protein product [Peniophora sp. CBMAI 1063]